MFMSTFGPNQHLGRDLQVRILRVRSKLGVGWGQEVGSKDRVREGRTGLKDKGGDPESRVDIRHTLALLKVALSLKEGMVYF